MSTPRRFLRRYRGALLFLVAPTVLAAVAVKEVRLRGTDAPPANQAARPETGSPSGARAPLALLASYPQDRP